MVTLDMAAGGLEEAGGGGVLAKEKSRKRRKAKSGEHGNPAADGSLEAAKNNIEKEEPSEERSPSGEYTKTEKKKKKKKKKKRLEEMGSADVPQHPLAQEEPSGKKLKKTKDTSVQSEAAGRLKMDKEGVPATREIKRPKKVKVVNQSQAIRLDEREQDDEDVVTKTTKKSKTGPKTGVPETLARGAEPQGVHQKAKKRKARSEAGDDMPQIVKNKKGKQEETTASVVVVDEKSPKPKKKKKNKKMKSETEVRESADSPEAEGAQGVSVVDGAKEQKRKKKKKPKLDEQMVAEDGAQNTETFVFVASTGDGRRDTKGASGDTNIEEEKEEVSVDRKKKKRNKKVKLEEQPGVAPTPEETPRREAVFLSEEAGNGDELTISQDRRLAPQMDIDKESSPKTPAKPSGFGQWGTAQFDSSDKQHKFLRLMGGFKKEAQASGPSPARLNMALTRDSQQDLQQALLGEFERAQSRRMDLSGRGAGLGFSAPPSKKFFIDANASRSVRFDD